MDKLYVVDVEFDTTVHISTRVALTEDEYMALLRLNRDKTITDENIVHKAIFPINETDVDYIEHDAEIENLEFELVDTENSQH